MKEKFYRFFAGRYGMDQLNRFLSLVTLVFVLVNLFAKNPLIWLCAVALLVWTYVRMLSRRHEKRRQENAKFLRIQNRLTGGMKNWVDRQKQRKDYCFFRCPSCKAMLRVPRGKGRIRVTCRKCGNAFERKT